MSNKPPPHRLLEALDDPESAELVRETLESLRRLSQQVGGAEVMNALRASVALTSDATLRADYDELRSQLVGYVRTLDDAKAQQPGAAETPFQASPSYGQDDMTALLELLLSAASGGSKPR